MIKRAKTILILFSFFLTALFLRTYKLSEYPAGFSQDEMAQGYLAYSLLKTGRDEWGVKFPLVFRSLGDFRLPAYAYLTMPMVKVFGLNEFATRLTAALFGVGAVLALYLLVKELFCDEKQVELLAFITAFLLLISPWHLSLSRVAHEASLTVFFLSLGLWLFLKGKEEPILLVLSGLFLGINLLTYHSPRFFTPMAVLLWLVFLDKTFLKKKIFKKSLLGFLIIFLSFFLISFYSLLGKGRTRITTTWLFSSSELEQKQKVCQAEALFLGISPKVESFFDNKITLAGEKFLQNYLEYLSPTFLFSQGVLEPTYGMMPGIGIMYLFELPLLLAGIYSLVKKKDRISLFLLFSLVLAPVPAAFTNQGRAGGRAVTMMPFLQIISGVGALAIWNFFSVQKKFQIALRILILLVIPLSFLNFVKGYFFHAPFVNAPGMAYGWREASQFLSRYPDQKILVSKNFSQPQMATAFFWQIDPLLVQEASLAWLDYEKKGFSWVDELPEYSLERFTFKNFDFPRDKQLSDTIFVGRQEDFGAVEGVKVLKTIYYPSLEKKVAFVIADFK